MAQKEALAESSWKERMLWIISKGVGQKQHFVSEYQKKCFKGEPPNNYRTYQICANLGSPFQEAICPA